MFNFELYKEGLRRCRVWGVLFAVIMLLGAFIQPITHLTSHAVSVRFAEIYGWMYFEPIIYIRGLSAFGLMPLTFIIAAPLLTLSIFAFLNSRDSSDFFHAIPHKRETVFISFIASILTWSLGVLFVTTAISTTIYAISSHTVVHFASILLILLAVVIVSLLVIGGITLAMAVTGTTLSNITTAALILFLPRLLILLFINSVLTLTPIIEFSNFPTFFNISYNLLFGFFDNNLHFYNNMFPQMLYTFVLGMVYLGFAGYLFKKRHSELATNPGSKWSQPIIRITVTFTLTLPALITIMVDRGHTGIEMLIFYLIAIIGYFVYEIFTARKIHSITQLLPGLGIVALLNIVFALGTMMTSNLFMRTINVSTVSSVVVDFDIHSQNHFGHWGWGGPIALSVGQLEIADSQVAQLLGEVLNGNIRRDYWHWGDGGGGQVRVTFTFDNGRDMTRLIWVPWDSDFVNWLHDYEPYRNLYLNFLRNFEFAWAWDNLTTGEIRNVLDVLYKEIGELDFRDWYALVGHFSRDGWVWNEHFGDWYDTLPERHGNITVEFQIDGRYFHYEIPITELTPLALELYRYYSGQRHREY